MTNSVQHVDKLSEYLNIIESNPCVVKLTAEWCGPCKRIAPIYEELATTHADSISFLEVNIDVAVDITKHESVQGVPLFLFYLYGTKIEDLSVPGAASSKLKNNLKQFLLKIEERKNQVVVVTSTLPRSEMEALTLDDELSDDDEYPSSDSNSYDLSDSVDYPPESDELSDSSGDEE